MKICIAGQGAFGVKHIEAVKNIPGIEIATSCEVMNSSKAGWPASVAATARRTAAPISPGSVTRSPQPPRSRAIAAYEPPMSVDR